MKKTLGSLLVVLVYATASLAATEELKIGYVDLQKALHTVESGKKAKGLLEKDIAAKRGELEKTEKKLRDEKEQLEKRAAILNEKARAEKEAEWQRKAIEFERSKYQVQMELQKRERDLTQPIIDEIRTVVEDIGKSKKYKLIVEKNEGAVLYAEAGSDITEEVIKRVDSQKKK